MEILNSIVVWAIKKRHHQIELFMKYPEEVQEEWFRKLLFRAKDTEWGKRFDFASIGSLREFKQRVPLQDYDSLKPDIERTIRGEQNVLWPSEINWFAKSSGTTSDKSKFIPVSKESLEECHFKGGKDLMALYFDHNPESKMLAGRGLVLGGSSEVNQFNGQSYWGDLSAVIIKNLPIWAEIHRTPSRKIALMPEWEEKIDKMARVTIDQNITSLTGVPSWTLVVLKKVLEITGKKSIGEVWPNLETYTHGGVSFIPYREQFDRIINLPNLAYMETYNASEGFFGIQDRWGTEHVENEMLLMLDYGIYFEFIPMENLDDEEPETLELQDVELFKSYALVISTNGGLWRYAIGDTIEFTSKAPYRIRITGRTKHFINAFGEEVIVDNAEHALNVACKKTNALISDYTACPVFMKGKEQGGHEWVIEFNREPDDFEYFISTFDTALKSVNSDYEAKRYKDFILRPPVIHKLPKGTFYKWMKKRGKLGGQNKVPRLANNRKYMDEILGLL